MSYAQQERNQEATLYVGNLDERVHEALLWELMLQAGPVANVYIPKDRVTQQHSGYGFVEFQEEEDSDYGCKIMNMVKLFGKPLRVNKASADKSRVSIGANLYIGNLAPEVDEKALFDTFSAFGTLLEAPVIQRENLAAGRAYGFVSYDNFESADAAIEVH
jgi:splicing factor 3B subunit 4